MCGKMAEELLSLKWNNHQAHFVDILTFLREQEIFVDATLACGGKLYVAHKFVLSTCSEYFKQMFTKNPSKHPIVFMKDVSTRDLEALLDFMYNGEVNVPQSSLGSLIKTAEGLQIKGLAVPDDPPAKRDRDRRDSKPQESLSPPPKRSRVVRENSPVQSLPSRSLAQSSYTPTPSSCINRPRSPIPPSNNSLQPTVEATVDEDSRTSVQSGVSGISEHNSSTTPSLSSKIGSSSQQIQSNTGDTSSRLEHGTEEPSPGPSGIQKPQSKEEPLEIKQEDIVDLGEDDEDWGAEGDAGGGDSSMGSEHPPSFQDALQLPHGSDAMQHTGDPAMRAAFGTVGDYVPLGGIVGMMPRRRATGAHPCPEQPSYPDLSYAMANTTADWRPHTCRFCQKKFKRKDHLTDHERLHTGERPYTCDHCGKGFAQKSNCRNHALRCPNALVQMDI